jgi:hypothetical protein
MTDRSAAARKGWATRHRKMVEQVTAQARAGGLEVVDLNDPWVGYRNGQIVASYPSQQEADQALIRRKVDMVAPVKQPGGDK